ARAGAVFSQETRGCSSAAKSSNRSAAIPSSRCSRISRSREPCGDEVPRRRFGCACAPPLGVGSATAWSARCCSCGGFAGSMPWAYRPRESRDSTSTFGEDEPARLPERRIHERSVGERLFIEDAHAAPLDADPSFGEQTDRLGINAVLFGENALR